jgi:hypothetical protein
VGRAALRVASRKRGHSQYLNDPVGFVREVLGEELWSKQREIAESVRDYRHVAVRSAHDTGKSFVASRLAAWWLSVHEPGDAFVVTTAPTFAQVRVILWREIIRAHKRGNLLGRTNQTEWLIDEEIVAYGRKPADYDEDAFQGIHARYVLVILDEANGVPPGLWTAVETITTNEGCRILAIGNPDSPLSQFKQVCDPGSGWQVIHVDGLQSPNFTGEDVPDSLRALLLSPEWVEERRIAWGEDSALFESKVRGNFPKVPEGAVYKELSPSQQWFGPEPAYMRYVGGLDFGGQNEQDHKTAGVVAGIAKDDSIDLAKVAGSGSTGVLVRKYHFEHSGPLVHDQLESWMRAVELKIGRRVEWKADKSQSGWISMARSKGFIVEPSDGSGGSVALGIGLQRRRMQVGSSFFLPELTLPPRFLSGDEVGQEMTGRSWYERMQNYVWELQPDETKQVKGNPLKRNDDTCDADRYMHEAVDAFPTYTGPIVSRVTTSGRPRARWAA